MFVRSFGATDSGEDTKHISLTNQSSQVRPTPANINSNHFIKPLYFAFNVTVNTCGVSCNTLDDLYALICVANKVRNMNAKVSNLMPLVNETRFLVQYQSSE